MTRMALAAGMVLSLVALVGDAEVVKVDPAIPTYAPETAVSGNLNSVGSDTMNNLMTLWAEGFAKFHPGVKIQVEGKGSSTATPALISGTAQLGPMSREMKDTEIDAVEAKYGFPPAQIVTSIDVLAVYVNKDNPIAGLSLPEVDTDRHQYAPPDHHAAVETGQCLLRQQVSLRQQPAAV